MTTSIRRTALICAAMIGALSVAGCITVHEHFHDRDHHRSHDLHDRDG